MKENNPREMPTKEIPHGEQPEKAPQRPNTEVPDTEPSKNNPRNPKEDKLYKEDILNT